MTKQVRIENADLSTWPVRITVQHFNAKTGLWENQPSPTQLNSPTAMVTDYLTSTRRLVIEEAHEDQELGLPNPYSL